MKAKKSQLLPFKNPYRPGAGHMPLYLAGRERELEDFSKHLKQEEILNNVVLTGLRGVGKTVLLETFRPMAIERGWGWVGNDFSETASISEESLVTRILVDLSILTTTMTQKVPERRVGFADKNSNVEQPINFDVLRTHFNTTPGLMSDKLKNVLEYAWMILGSRYQHGIVFAYDEAQNLTDHVAKEQYPLSLLLDVFQSIQRKGVRFMLVLTGLPTLFPKLVEARTFSERMFHVMTLTNLKEEASKDAILKPLEETNCPVAFDNESVTTIIQVTNGYPYFIQFICRETYDIWVADMGKTIPIQELLRKLDNDFFLGRWARATDRQRDLLGVIATLPNCDDEFTVQDIVSKSKKILEKGFSNSHVSQMLSSLGNAGLVYKNRYGKYSFAVPLLGQFILRQQQEIEAARTMV